MVQTTMQGVSSCTWVMQVETFKKLHGEDQMAVDKLKEGIDGFAKDQIKLEAMVHEITEGARPMQCRASPKPKSLRLWKHAACLCVPERLMLHCKSA